MATRTNYSVYPNSYDSYGTIRVVTDGKSEIIASDHNALRDAVIKIQNELGLQPSGVYATVRSRLDSVADASVTIESHLIDTLDAHDASAISILDSAGNYSSSNVEGALTELAAVLPEDLDSIGEDSSLANSGIPNFVSGNGSLHIFNTSGGTDVLDKTQPVSITGIHIIEVGDNNGTGTAQLQLSNHSPATLKWKAPGDSSFGTGVDISGMSEGDIETISSDTSTKSIRIVRTGASLPAASPATENFDVFRFGGSTGAFSITDVGIVDSDKITRTAITGGTSRDQFMIGGVVFPADQGTLVLQRKRRSDSAFIPIATLDLGSNFDEDNRAAGQNPYVPAFSSYDTITLFDRLPARVDYESLESDADGDQVYSNFTSLTTTFSPFQLAKYLIPISNPNITNATIDGPSDITQAEMEAEVSSYRLVHYKSDVTDFTGEPASTDILSVVDALGAVDDGDNNVRMSNVMVDDDTTRPTITQLVMRPELSAETNVKMLSGIHYYNNSNDLFDIELKADTNLFSNAYKNTGILQLSSDVFQFDGYGASVAVTEMIDDGYTAFSDTNLPDFTTQAYYISNLTINANSRLYPATDKFSTKSYLRAALHDPFGTGGETDSYGITSEGTELRILANSYGRNRSTRTIEYFTDEDFRVGSGETFGFDLDVGQYSFEHGAGSGGTLDDWDHTAVLSAGELQCGGRWIDGLENIPGLIFPQSDYTGSNIRPTQQSLVDYSGAAYETTSTYMRLFSLGKVTNGGRLRIVSDGNNLINFDNIDASNSNRPIQVSIKIPGSGNNSTGWMDLGKMFQSGKYSDGNGCLAGEISGGNGDFTARFTTGLKNNADTGYMFAVRVTYFGSTQLADVKTRIITRIELLE